tara:strand:+ start:147 stop:800 length:654 start_codon:yes stop_codon:yes gene_type:complete
MDIHKCDIAYIPEGTTADINLTAPRGRWRYLHNALDTPVSILVPSNEVYLYTAESGADRSNYHGATNSGKMDNDESVVGTITASSYSSISGDTSGTVTVTRNAPNETTAAIVPPSFDGIDLSTTAVTDCVVTSTEGSGLQPGDVLSFPLVTNPTITITITLGENDLQLGAGLNVLKATTVVLGLTLAPYETVACNFTQVQVQALDNGNNALVTGYFA